MHSTRSLIKSAVETVRMNLNEPLADSKFDDDYLVRYQLQAGVTDVFGRLQSSYDMPIRLEHTLSLVADQRYYQIPPSIHALLRIYKLDDYGNVTWDWRPRGEFDHDGPGWSIQGNTIEFRPYPTEAEDITLVYIAAGDALIHYAATGGAPSALSNATSYTLANTPTLGLRGTRDQEYAGMMLRILDTSRVHERVIESYDAATRVATFRQPIASLASGVSYEVVPLTQGKFWEAVAYSACLKLSASLRLSGAHHEKLAMNYRDAMKTLRDWLSNVEQREGKHFKKDTIDNPESGYYWLRR